MGSPANLATIASLLPFETLEHLAREILREPPGVVSVTYSVGPRPPSTIGAV